MSSPLPTLGRSYRPKARKENNMAKNKPIINHTKIICYAILHLQNEIETMRQKCEGKPEAEELLKHFTEQFDPELEALKELYRIETGVEYN